MREKSHIDDMRSAIRGDFERLAERRGGQELMRPASEQHDDPADEGAAPPDPEELEAPEVDQVLMEGAEGPDATSEPEVLEADRPSLVPIRHEDDNAPVEPMSPELVTIRHEVVGDAEDEERPSDDVPAGEPGQLHEEPPGEEPRRRSWLDKLLGR